MTVINDIGGDGNDADALVNGLTLPSKASVVTITSPWVNHIRFKGNAMNPKTELIIEKTYFEGYKVVGSKCDKTNIDISIGNHAIELIETKLDANKISGCWVEVTDSRIDANNINVDVLYDYSSEITCKTLTTKLGASIEGGKIEADTMNLGQYVWFGSSPTLKANKITMGEVELESNVNVSVKTDKKGNSLFNVGGLVTYNHSSEKQFIISLCDTKGVLLNKGEIIDGKTILVTAPKVDSRRFDLCIDQQKENHTTYKSGKTMLYGSSEDKITVISDDNYSSWYDDFNYAMSDINSRNSKEATYTVYLRKDTEVKSKGKYTSLVLPDKAKMIKVMGYDNRLIFSGNITLKTDLTLQNVDLTPVNSAPSKNGDYTESVCDINVGGYLLGLASSELFKEDGTTTVLRNISGNKNGSIYVSNTTVIVNNVTGIEKLIKGSNAVFTVKGKSSIKP